MSEVIDLRKWKEEKQGKKATENGLKQIMKDSLDNETVKRRYNIATKDKPEPTLEQRQERIKESIKRINKLMDEIKERT